MTFPQDAGEIMVTTHRAHGSAESVRLDLDCGAGLLILLASPMYLHSFRTAHHEDFNPVRRSRAVAFRQRMHHAHTGQERSGKRA
jgi:hypothetical protein